MNDLAGGGQDIPWVVAQKFGHHLTAVFIKLYKSCFASGLRKEWVCSVAEDGKRVRETMSMKYLNLIMKSVRYPWQVTGWLAC